MDDISGLCAPPPKSQKHKKIINWKRLLLITFGVIVVLCLASQVWLYLFIPRTESYYFNPDTRKVELYDTLGNKISDLTELPNEGYEISSAKYFKSINKIAFVSSLKDEYDQKYNSRITLYDLNTNELKKINEISSDTKNETSIVSYQDVDYLTGDDKYIAFSMSGWEWDGMVLYSLEQDKLSLTITGRGALTFSPDGENVIYNTSPGEFTGSDISVGTGEKIGELIRQDKPIETNLTTIDPESMRGDKSGLYEDMGREAPDYVGAVFAYWIDNENVYLVNYKYSHNNGAPSHKYVVNRYSLPENSMEKYFEFTTPSFFPVDYNQATEVLTMGIDQKTGEIQIIDLKNKLIEKHYTKVPVHDNSDRLSVLSIKDDIIMYELEDNNYPTSTRLATYMYDTMTGRNIRLEKITDDLIYIN